MKIHTRQQHFHYPSSQPTARFQGWGAAPLKQLFLQPQNLKLVRELETIGQQEGFEVVTQTDVGFDAPYPPSNSIKKACWDPWGQDNKQFVIGPAGEEVLQVDHSKKGQWVQALAQHLNLSLKTPHYELPSGDFFLGKAENGEFYGLLGRPSFNEVANKLAGKAMFDTPTQNELKEAKNQIAQDYHLKPKNLFVIDGPNSHHIDTATRPLKHKKILLGDSGLSVDCLQEAFKKTQDPDKKHRLQALIWNTELNGARKRARVRKINNTEQQLRRAGFEVVRVPGVFDHFYNPGNGHQTPNFMNAVVHQRPDGKLVYITNDSDFPELNDIFATYLKTVAPEVAEVYFVSGGSLTGGGNYLTRSFNNQSGGALHCMSSERPDFKNWIA